MTCIWNSRFQKEKILEGGEDGELSRGEGRERRGRQRFLKESENLRRNIEKGKGGDGRVSTRRRNFPGGSCEDFESEGDIQCSICVYFLPTQIYLPVK